MTERISVLVVDDEPLARDGLVALFEADPDFQVAGRAASVAEAVIAIQAKKPQLIMLDVQMADGTGFDVIQQVGVEEMPIVVFVTAYNEFAVEAFEVNAIDYLLKPFDDERFAKAVQRAKKAIQQEDVAVLNRRIADLLGNTGGSRYAERVPVKSNGRVVFLRTDEIDWIEAADYYVRIHVGKDAHLLRESMVSLEGRLDPARFFRLHRGAIVNLDRIHELQPHYHGDYLVVLQNGTKLKLSRAKRDQLHERLR